MNFHCIGMRNMQGKGLDHNGNEFDPESHFAGLLYLEKAEAKVAKMSRERFLKLWDRELIKLGDADYNKSRMASERGSMAFAYKLGRDGKGLHPEYESMKYQDIFERGQRDAERVSA